MEKEGRCPLAPQCRGRIPRSCIYLDEAGSALDRGEMACWLALVGIKVARDQAREGMGAGWDGEARLSAHYLAVEGRGGVIQQDVDLCLRAKRDRAGLQPAE